MFQGFIRGAIWMLVAIAICGLGDRIAAGGDGSADEDASLIVPPDDLMLAPTQAWTYHDIALTQAKAGDVSGALKTVSQIRGEWKKAWTYRRIAVAQAEARDVSGAMKTVSQIRDKTIKNWTYREIADVQARAGNVSGAIKTLSQIRG
jgi:hypothetical protein